MWRAGWTAALALCVASSACAQLRAPAVTRELAGQPTPGPFVPPHAYQMYLQGELLLQKGQPAAAVAALQQALAAPEVDPFVLCRLGLALYRAGEVEQGRARLAEAEEFDPCEPELWRVRATLAMAEGQRQRALSSWERALQCRPGDPEATRARLQLLAAMGADARVRALQAEDAAGVVSPPAARRAALRDAIARGELRAIRRLLGPDEQVAQLPWALRARALARLGDRSGAARAWRMAAPLREADLPEAARCLSLAGAHREAALAAGAALDGPLGPDQARRMREVQARALHAAGEIRDATRRLPPGAEATLADWLEQAGLVGMAAQLRPEPPAQ